MRHLRHWNILHLQSDANWALKPLPAPFTFCLLSLVPLTFYIEVLKNFLLLLLLLLYLSPLARFSSPLPASILAKTKHLSCSVSSRTFLNEYYCICPINSASYCATVSASIWCYGTQNILQNYFALLSDSLLGFSIDLLNFFHLSEVVAHSVKREKALLLQMLRHIICLPFSHNLICKKLKAKNSWICYKSSFLERNCFISPIGLGDPSNPIKTLLHVIGNKLEESHLTSFPFWGCLIWFCFYINRMYLHLSIMKLSLNLTHKNDSW